MKYLIISDAASMHVYNFVRFFLAGEGNEIYILRHSLMEIPEEYRKFYAENNVTVFTADTPDASSNRLATAKRLIRKCIFLLKLGRVDVCHIHYLHMQSILLYKLFKRNFKRLVLTYWGTDVLIPSEKEIQKQKQILPYADKITVTVKNSKIVFCERFGHGYDDKLEVVHFPSGAVPKIKEISEKKTRQQCREEIGVPDGKLLLVCGYNADPAQRQDICLNEISLLPEELKDRLHVVIPVQYNRFDNDYIERVKQAAAECGTSYEVLEEYVPFERNAVMCLATDIYLNLRISDAFSNAMKEQVTAGSLMIQGDWLNYIEVDEMNAPVVKISDLSELHTALEKVMKNYTFKTENEIFYPMYNIFDPTSLKNEWERIFRSLNL
ncbi:MAG: hypothetical protein IJL63_01095 [Clostridia bacterium]|nr:hypothetical protein [Clostridia bacterium]